MKPLHSAPTLADAHFEIDKQIKAYKDCWCSIKKLQKAKQVLAWLTESDYQELHSKYLEEEKEKITYHPNTDKYEYRWIMYNSYVDAKKTNKQFKRLVEIAYNADESIKEYLDRKKKSEETSRKLNKYLSIIAIITIILVILFTILWTK